MHKLPSHVTEICTSNATLKDLLLKIQYLTQLTSLVNSHLTEPLRSHVVVANYRDGCLVLALDNAVWATELRYKHKVLLAALQTNSALLTLTSLEWIIVGKI